MAGIMPPEALAAVRKVSPEPLYKLALRERARVTVETLCTDMASARLGYVDGQAYRRQMERLFSGEIERFNLWGTLSLEMWLRRYWQ